MTWKEEEISWEIEGSQIRLGLTRFGKGPSLLLLPALSSISTRDEMRSLQESLAAHYETLSIDWPGFGTLPRPSIAWRPHHLQQFLAFVAREIMRPEITLAAGHASGYALAQAASQPDTLGKLCLLSPTWRGPLPTMAGRRMALFKAAADAVDLPAVGSALYRTNVNSPVIKMMARGHVYSNREWLTPERMRDKLKVTEAPGARHASFRFVTGQLDLFHDRATFLETASRSGADILTIYGSEAPRKSKLEMTALAELENVTALELPHGKLSFYEEFPEETAKAILSQFG